MESISPVDITWLKQKFRFEDALTCAQRERSSRVVEVTNSYLEHLFKCNRVSEAASEAKRLLGENKELWESWMFRFRDAGHLMDVLENIPSQPRLRTSYVTLSQ
jgi:vacuolar protein sorting-associated protein 41